MIDYQTYCAIHDHHNQRGLNAAQIAEALQLDPRTVATWLAEPRFRPRQASARHEQARSPQADHPPLAGGAPLQRPAGVSAPAR